MIKKIGIVTFHNAINYGAILQTFALSKAIEKTGNTCIVLNYECERIKRGSKIKIRFKNPRQLARDLLYLPCNLLRKVRFINFKRKNLVLTKRLTKQQLQKYNNQFDLFITGSDQVWNYQLTDFEKAFFLDFVNDNSKKYSYAASFGFDFLPQEYRQEYKELLSYFNKISVREKAGVTILSKLGIEACEVLDPTFLLEKNDWAKVFGDKKIKEEYILVYSYTSKILKDFAIKLSEHTNCKIIDISFSIKNLFNKRYISKVGIGPKEFLSLLYNARYVVTNSFHGTALAINFNKPLFIEFLPPPSKVNSRLENIIEIFELKGRIIEEGKKIAEYEPIDYGKVNLILQREREKSLAFLKSIIHEN